MVHLFKGADPVWRGLGVCGGQGLEQGHGGGGCKGVGEAGKEAGAQKKKRVWRGTNSTDFIIFV